MIARKKKPPNTDSINKTAPTTRKRKVVHDITQEKVLKVINYIDEYPNIRISIKEKMINSFMIKRIILIDYAEF